MERIQLYPPENLKKMMQKEAELKALNISQLAVTILMQYYGLVVSSANRKTLPAIIDEVIEEVKTYVNENKPGTTFDLLNASELFKNIHMVADGKPSTNRATVGKVFASKLGKEVFKNVAVVRTETGDVIKSVNRATMYVILEEKTGSDEM